MPSAVKYKEQHRRDAAYRQISSQENWLQRIIHSEVETTVHDDTNTWNVESTVETGNTISCQCLFVDINQTIELPLSSLLCSLSIISQTGTGIVQRVNKEKGWSTSRTTRGQVTSKPFPVTILVLLEVEKPLEVILECKVQGLVQVS